MRIIESIRWCYDNSVDLGNDFGKLIYFSLKLISPFCIQLNHFVYQSMNQKFDETAEKTQRRLQSASLLFEKIVDNFPSSWPVCSKVYKSLLYSPLNMEIDYSKSMCDLSSMKIFSKFFLTSQYG